MAADGTDAALMASKVAGRGRARLRAIWRMPAISSRTGGKPCRNRGPDRQRRHRLDDDCDRAGTAHDAAGTCPALCRHGQGQERPLGAPARRRCGSDGSDSTQAARWRRTGPRKASRSPGRSGSRPRASSLSREQEVEGLDLALHDERVYNHWPRFWLHSGRAESQCDGVQGFSGPETPHCAAGRGWSLCRRFPGYLQRS